MKRLSFGKLSPTSWVTVQTVYTQGFGVAVFAVQAPLLGPRAFGLMAIIMVFVSFCEALLDTATEALLSVPRIDPLHYATMNGINAVFGIGFGLALAMAAGPLAAWFGEPQLAAVARSMAILPLLSGLGCAPNAATKRQMEFKPLAIRMISGVTCGGLVGILLTILGGGVWALVLQTIVQRGVSVAVLWRGSPLPFQLALSRRHWRDLSVFAWPLLISRAMTWTSSQLPRFILARNLTVAELGLFSLAARLSDIVVQVTLVPRAAVARVELSHFAAESAGLELAVSKFLRWMSALCFPLSIGGAVLAPTLIHAWLNTKWLGAIVPAQALLLSSCAWVTFYGGGILLLARNQQRSEAAMSIAQTATVVLTTLVFGPYGLVAASVAMAIRPLLLVPLAAVLVRRNGHVSPRALLASQGCALCAAAGSGLLVLLVRERVETLLGNGFALVTLGAAGLATYAALLFMLQPQMLRQLLPRSQPQT